MTSRPPDHFDQLPTSWTLLEQAHDPAAPADRRTGARQQLLERYANVARRYLGGALRAEPSREEAVNDCFQEFSILVMSGALHGAAPERGRFRGYLRVLLGNLVTDYHRRRRRRRSEGLGDREPEVSDPGMEEGYQEIWREDLIGRALQALDRHEQKTGQRLYSVLKLKMDHPEWRAEQLAEELARAGAGPVRTDWVRQRLFRARTKLCELLRLEVQQTLREPTEEQVDEELAELGLLEYLRPPAR